MKIGEQNSGKGLSVLMQATVEESQSQIQRESKDKEEKCRGMGENLKKGNQDYYIEEDTYRN